MVQVEKRGAEMGKALQGFAGCSCGGVVSSGGGMNGDSYSCGDSGET